MAMPDYNGRGSTILLQPVINEDALYMLRTYYVINNIHT